MTRLFTAVFVFAILCGTTGCDTYSHPIEPASKEEMKKNERVYGEVDGPAQQSLNTYEADPEVATKAAVLKAKLFGQAPPATAAAGAPVVIDTAAALKASAE
jgi:hypothetical protein